MKQYWYPRLLAENGPNSLESATSPQERNKGIIVRWEAPDGFKFGIFPEVVDLTNFILNQPPHLRLFHEIVIGDRYQKPRFDLDMELEKIQGDNLNELGERLLNQIIQGIKHVYEEIHIRFDLERDVVVCTSHGPEKKSYHIIVCGMAVENCEQALVFKEKVLEHVDPELHIFVDNVYKSHQSLRILGSRKTPRRDKIIEPRFKIFEKTLTLEGKTVTHLFDKEARNEKMLFHLQLMSTLLSFTAGLEVITVGEPKVKVQSETTPHFGSEIVKIAMDALAKNAGITVSDPRFPYQYRDVKGNMIILQRVKPSLCPLCKRAHENENPYLQIVGHQKTLVFVCRRAEMERGKNNGRMPIRSILPDILRLPAKNILMPEQLVLPQTSTGCTDVAESLNSAGSDHSTDITSSDESGDSVKKAKDQKEKFVDPRFSYYKMKQRERQEVLSTNSLNRSTAHKIFQPVYCDVTSERLARLQALK